MAITSRWARPVLAAAAGVALAASGAAWASGATGSGNPSRFGPAPGSLHSAATRPSQSGRFYGVAASSSRDIWAVGLGPNDSLIMHYSGSRTKRYRWRVSFTKPVGYFLGAAAMSARNVWAVGG